MVTIGTGFITQLLFLFRLEKRGRQQLLEISSRETSEEEAFESDHDESVSEDSWRNEAEEALNEDDDDGKDDVGIDDGGLDEDGEASDEGDVPGMVHQLNPDREDSPAIGDDAPVAQRKRAAMSAPPAVNPGKRECHPNDDVDRECQFCGATSTPQWRRGPGGKDTLCNACGVRYRKSLGPGGFQGPAVSEPTIIKPKLEPEPEPGHESDEKGEMAEASTRALVWAQRRKRASCTARRPDSDEPSTSEKRHSRASSEKAGNASPASEAEEDGQQGKEDAAGLQLALAGPEAGSGSAEGHLAAMLRSEEPAEVDRGLHRLWQPLPNSARGGRRVAESRNGDTEVSSDGHLSPAMPPNALNAQTVAIPNPDDFELSPPTLRGTTEADREKCWQWLINMSSKVGCVYARVLDKEEWLDFVGRVNFAEQIPWPKIMWVSLTTCCALVQLAPGCRVGPDDLQRLQAEIRKISAATTGLV
eukprot:scaffold222750_cov39-Prasinocladus_malaysianus.AAC.1